MSNEGMKSPALHLLDGTYRPDRHEALIEPDATRQKPNAPDHITGNRNTGKVDREALFNFWADYLYGEGYTRDIDGIIVGQLVETYIQYVNSVNLCRNDTDAMMGKTLASSMMMKFAKEIREILEEFRLTPKTRTAYRQSLKDAGNIPADPVAEFLAIAKKGSTNHSGKVKKGN